MSDPLVIAGREFRSRLIVGTGKYKSFQETARALEVSGAEIVTVAVRRVNLDRSKESLLDYIDPRNTFCFLILPVATRLTKPYARQGWDARWESPIGSSWKSSAIRRRFIQTFRRRSKQPVRWSRKDLRFYRIPQMTWYLLGVCWMRARRRLCRSVRQL